MKSKICKSATLKVTKNVTETYQLVEFNKKYSIICIENNLLTNKQNSEKVMNITTDRSEALRIFKFLVKNKACEGTIKDIISDQMC